jgi:hypothetical protein
MLRLSNVVVVVAFLLFALCEHFDASLLQSCPEAYFACNTNSTMEVEFHYNPYLYPLKSISNAE